MLSHDTTVVALLAHITARPFVDLAVAANADTWSALGEYGRRGTVPGATARALRARALSSHVRVAVADIAALDEATAADKDA